MDKQKDTSKSPVFPKGLFDKIICAIKEEKELQQTRKLFITFVLFFLFSLITLPLSIVLFINKWHTSRASYFVSSILVDIPTALTYWQDFILSVAESLPLLPIALLIINIALTLFTVRLFLHKKAFLLQYLRHSFIMNHG